MEPKENDFEKNIPEGFEVPNRVLSFEWKFYFRSLSLNKHRRYKAKCMFCGKEFEGRTERLSHHFLDKDCPAIPNELLDQYKIDYMDNLAKKNRNEKGKNETTTQYSEFDNDILNEIALKFVLSANIPFRVVDNPYFKRLIDYASSKRPECHISSSTTMRYQLLNNFVTKIKLSNAEQISTCSNLTIAMDGWTDITGKSLYAIFAISSSKQHLLSIDDLSSVQNNALNLKDHLKSVVFQHNRIEPSSVIAIVTDTPRVMESMKSNIQAEYNNIIPLKCVLHVLNLMCKDIGSLEISKEVIKDNSAIVNYFKSSHMLLSWIQKYQKENNISHTIQSFTEIRWFSLSKLCQSVQTYKEAFQEAVKVIPIKNLHVSDIIKDELHFLKNKYLLDIINPIADNIGYLEKDSATIGDVLFSVLDIYIKIESIEIPRSYVLLKTSALKSVFKRFLDLNKNPIYIVGFFLWPKFKRVVISEKNTLSNIIRHIIELSISWELFNIDEAKQLYSELNLYAESRRQFYLTDNDLNLLPREYWKNYPFIEHPIYKFTNKVFSICPHSASVERLFSMLGMTKTNSRNRMSTSTLFKIAIARHQLRDELRHENQVECHNEILHEKQHTNDSESEFEEQMAMFFDEYEESNDKVDEYETDSKNNEVNTPTFTEESLQTLAGQQCDDLTQSIYQYFDLNLFRAIIYRNDSKTPSSTNLDSLAPPAKKARNNYRVEDIIPELL